MKDKCSMSQQEILFQTKQKPVNDKWRERWITVLFVLLRIIKTDCAFSFFKINMGDAFVWNDLMVYKVWWIVLQWLIFGKDIQYTEKYE